MRTYDIKKIAVDSDATQSGVVRIKPIHAPLVSELQYLRALRGMLRNINQATRDYILPRYKRMSADKVLLDAEFNDIDASMFSEVFSGRAAWIGLTTAAVDGILRREGDRHTRQFNTAIKSSLGIDMSAILTSSDIRGAVRTSSAFSASLITKLADDAIKRIESTVYQAALTGESYSSLTKKVRSAAGISDRRANLIARDQVQKLNGNLNKIRQEQVGITEYEWVTVGDSKVRRDHAERSGRVFRWGTPPGDGHPGEAVNCRCTSAAVVRF